MWSAQRSCLNLCQQTYYSTQEVEKEPEEEPLHTIISDTESVQGSFSKHEFQAETKKLLDIVARSLYSEKEVFIRELISNGSDALEKLRHKLMTAGGETAPMEIHLQSDTVKGTFTIQDTGVGMDQEELVANLGTIARSGSKAFLDALQNKAEASSSIIDVRVGQQQQRWSSRPSMWSAQRSCLNLCQQTYYSTQEVEKEPEEEPLHTIISDTESVQGSFSKHEFQAETKKLLDIVARSLYSEKEVFIRELISNGSDALEKLRHKLMTAGGETAPMEIHLQSDTVKGTFTIQLRDVLQQRVIRFLLDQSKKEPEKYNKFFEDYGLFMREGIVTTQEQDVREDIAKLLRFESSALPAGEHTNLMEYASRMKAGTRNIYYICAPNRHLAEHSPYFEAMKQKEMEVLFCYEQFDELTLLHLREFDKKKLISAETDIVVDHYKEEKFEDSKPASERLTQEQADDLLAWMKNALGPRVTNIKLTPRLDTHPAMITVLEMGAARHFLRTQQLARSAEERAQILQPTLEINAGSHCPVLFPPSDRHDLIKKLQALKDTNSDLAGLLLEQIYDNAMITAGLNDDPRPMIARLNDLLTKALEKH
ncbi:hypothetical protein F2P81_014985 [Scophthalmus maximus]|uniref:Histidine kinase/HSP90-like ATPase domain-containing protein n=1 Tax=Scophthalmus maximus TaxID=52904 RepID=A0A6A4SJB7_SCOMX|nr:hypothetical protein F2P81_014985 [Scophthalmus maximus]